MDHFVWNFQTMCHFWLCRKVNLDVKNHICSWTRSLLFDIRVESSLAGSYILYNARDAEQLSRNKVTHILSVHDSARPMLEGVKYLCIPAADSPSQNLTRHFRESIKFIHECRLGGEGCLVHCLAGVSRSVTLVVAYIMTVTDFGWEDALHTVRAGRSCANPNLGFQRQLQEFEKHQVHQFRQWLREEYGENPLRDAEAARSILGKYKEQGRAEPPPGTRRWSSFQALAPLPHSSHTTET
ncbi:dual specificity protein phosphatase 22 isoform X5 [Camelus bactrianus]|uniref:Dual specificity protein phosphatase 22 isoform X5 n=1 Tax=Camelus bactrianus TaxID=9837 RepID=A0AC58P1Y8_CAMBA